MSYHRYHKWPNLIKEFVPTAIDQLYVRDITYWRTELGFLFISLITDVFSNKIVGYHVANTLETIASRRALEMALKGMKRDTKKLIHHSDRGLQYCCDEYQQFLIKSKITCSMTESYDPYQNAVTERINGILKHEFILGIITTDIELMGNLIDEPIDIYNNERPLWSCWMKTPNSMHQQKEIKIRTYKTKNSIETFPDAI